VLLDSIDRLEIEFIDSTGKSSFYWPPTASEGKQFQPPVPSGIRLRFSLPHWGELDRVIQLRDVRPS
jgi:hypothetical protein